LNHRVGRDDVRRASQCFRIVHCQRSNVAERADRSAHGLRATGRYTHDVGTELREFRYYESMHAFADRRQQDHGSDADADAQRRQPGTQALRSY
jgi:hypothetical protein